MRLDLVLYILENGFCFSLQNNQIVVMSFFGGRNLSMIDLRSYLEIISCDLVGLMLFNIKSG